MNISTKEYDRLLIIVSEAQKILKKISFSKDVGLSKDIGQFDTTKVIWGKAPPKLKHKPRSLKKSPAFIFPSDSGWSLLKQTKNNAWVANTLGYVYHYVHKGSQWRKSSVLRSNDYNSSIVNDSIGGRLWKVLRDEYPHAIYNVCRKFRGGIGKSGPKNATHYDVYIYKRPVKTISWSNR